MPPQVGSSLTACCSSLGTKLNSGRKQERLISDRSHWGRQLRGVQLDPVRHGQRERMRAHASGGRSACGVGQRGRCPDAWREPFIAAAADTIDTLRPDLDPSAFCAHAHALRSQHARNTARCRAMHDGEPQPASGSDVSPFNQQQRQEQELQQVSTRKSQQQHNSACSRCRWHAVHADCALHGSRPGTGSFLRSPVTSTAVHASLSW